VEQSPRSTTTTSNQTPLDPQHDRGSARPGAKEKRMTARTALQNLPAISLRAVKRACSTLPILLVGSMAVTLGTAATPAPTAPRTMQPKAAHPSRDSEPLAAAATAVAAVAPRAATLSYSSVSLSKTATHSAPHTYRVAEGDTVSSIAGKFGLSTASVLALNGLGWKTTIFPGQQLRLTKSTATAPAAQTAGHHTVRSGETVSSIASKHGLGTSAVLRANGLSASSIIYPGQRLALPKSKATISSASASSVRPISSGSTTAQAATKKYVIATGDTISSIAKRFGVSTDSILEANSLTATSLIYAGRSIVVPRALTAAALTPAMRDNARTIIRVGRELGVSNKGIVIALAAALQESTLRNLDYGHLDSVGLFQQRPSFGWGSRGALRSPAHAARLFYGGPANPNVGVTRGLLDIPGWQSMSVTRAAQAVQVSAFPTAYAKWEKSARAMLADLG